MVESVEDNCDFSGVNTKLGLAGDLTPAISTGSSCPDLLGCPLGSRCNDVSACKRGEDGSGGRENIANLGCRGAFMANAEMASGVAPGKPRMKDCTS
jgi:hypothetical protein